MTYQPQPERERALMAAALRRRMTEQKLTAEKLATLCGMKSRDAVTKWRTGKHWPPRLGQGILTAALRCPMNFFDDIVHGVPYEIAVQPETLAYLGPRTDVERYRKMPLVPSFLPFVEEEEAHRIFGVPLPTPDLVQVKKFQQMLDYLTAIKVGMTIVALATALSFPLAIVTEWAEGKRSVPEAVIERIAHRWDLRESFWTAPAEASWLDYIGRRRREETADDGGTMLLQATAAPELIPVTTPAPERRTEPLPSATAAATQLLAEMSAQMRSLQEGCSRVERLLQSLVKDEIV